MIIWTKLSVSFELVYSISWPQGYVDKNSPWPKHPIDMAPKDGTRINLFVGDAIHKECWWYDDNWGWVKPDPDDFGHGCISIEGQPVYWSQ